MIFKPVLAEAVMEGRKTATRRPLRAGDTRSRYQPGHHYAVQPGRGKHQIGRILIDRVALERLGDLTDLDAQREGFANRDEFADYWRALYGGKWDPEQYVWVIEFHVTPGLPGMPVPRA